MCSQTPAETLREAVRCGFEEGRGLVHENTLAGYVVRLGTLYGLDQNGVPWAPTKRGTRIEGRNMLAVGGIGIVGILVIVLIVLAIIYFVRRS
jgi:hypothetical protein